MLIERIETRRDQIADARLVASPAAALEYGEALFRVERYALTANNVTYAVIGEQFGY